METVLKIARFYLLSIDAVIRLIGTYLITGLLFAALGLLSGFGIVLSAVSNI